MSTPNIFRTNNCMFRVIDWREFMGRKFVVCETITNGGYTSVATFAEDSPDLAPASQEEWAEALARATKAKAKADKQEEFRLRKDGYGRDGLRVGAKSYDVASHLTINAIKAIESACGGADTYDFIKAGEDKESAK